MRAALWLAGCVVAGANLFAQPARKLRDLTTDRPDRTESPITVDKGHVQVEIDFVNVTQTAASIRSYGFGAVNAKLGLRDNVDLQLVSQVHERTKVGTLTTTSTLPDVMARLKVNLWGNDGGKTAAALMPFVTVPTESGGSVEGGLIVPLAVELGRGWGFGTMSELDLVRSETSASHQLNVVHSVTFGHDLTSTVGMYGELAAELRNAAVKTVATTANTGLTLRVGGNLQFDAGANAGLNDHADRIRVFVGMARRY
jgi:hypothetical protein